MDFGGINPAYIITPIATAIFAVVQGYVFYRLTMWADKRYVRLESYAKDIQNRDEERKNNIQQVAREIARLEKADNENKAQFEKLYEMIDHHEGAVQNTLKDLNTGLLGFGKDLGAVQGQLSVMFALYRPPGAGLPSQM